MIPRWPLFLAFGLAGLLLAVPAVWGLFVDSLPVAATAIRIAGIVINGLIFVTALVDLFLSHDLRRVEVRRETSDVMSVGARNAVRIWFINRNREPLEVEFHDEHPLPGETAGLPFSITLPPLRERYRVYHLEPRHRGQHKFGDIYLRCPSRFGFWSLHEQRPLPQPVRVYPDIQAVHGIELLARKNRMAETGGKLSRLHGSDTEFDRLREYRREDELRRIDWKASARVQKLISREYVVERNQNILFVLDCGRSMCNELDGVSHLDRALNAAIAVGYVALRQGDNVGLLACSNQVRRWVRPVRGTGGIQSLIRQTYDLEPDYEATDYGLMVEELRRRYRKRSLVILLTHTLDDLHLESICQHVRQLKNPHLVLVSFLQNVPLVNRMNTVPQTDPEAFQVAAAMEMVTTQSLEIARLQRSGLLVLDTLPEQLSANLISRYLDIKARNLL